MKYYKVEDVINTLADQWRFEQEMEYSDTAEDIEEWEKVARKLFADLPTIEVSEEVLKATKNFNAYTIADENAEMGMRTQIEPIVEVSEDCISREYLKSFEYINKGDFNSVETIREWIDNAPSVVPSCQKNRQVERAEGEWVYIEEPIMDNPYGRYRCSECDIEKPHETDYCPNCGAKMKGADDD